MTTLTEKFHSGGFLVSEANGRRSREAALLLSGAGVVLTGTVLGRRYLGGSAVAAAFAANTGNGVMGAITVTGPARPGVYRLVMIEPGANVGTFQVEDPDGKFVGRGAVAAAFSAGGLAFTLADGGTDFIAGDGFNITVSGGTFKYLTYDPAATLGEQTPAAILHGAGGDSVDATSADKSATIIARHAEINASELVWFAGATTQQKTDALAVLAAIAGIVAR